MFRSGSVKGQASDSNERYLLYIWSGNDGHWKAWDNQANQMYFFWNSNIEELIFFSRSVVKNSLNYHRSGKEQVEVQLPTNNEG